MTEQANRGPRRRFNYANVMSTLAVFLVIAGASAQALPGANTVFSDDIVNGEVKTPDLVVGAATSGKIRNGEVKRPDLATGAVNSPKILDGAVKRPDLADNAVDSAKVADESLTGGDIANGSLTGGDVAESTLDQVPSATLGGVGRGTGTAACNPPTNGTFVTCRTLTISHDRPARALVLARLSVSTNAFEHRGTCVLLAGPPGAPDAVPGSSIGIFKQEDEFVEEAFTSGVTGVLPAGDAQFFLDCNHTVGNISNLFDETTLQVVLLSPS